MTLRTFSRNLLARGYVKSAHPAFYTHYFTSANKGIVVDNMHGGAYRLFLGVNCIPECCPFTTEIAKKHIDAESPWFEYVEREEKDDALDRCWQWLESVGFSFLADPFSRELHRWITEEHILIRGQGIIPIPRVRKLPP